MAKTQSMSLNPVKISGTCGRLMCCLRYEQEVYEDLVKHVPKNGAFVQTVDGYGNVTLVNLLRQTVKVRLDGQSDDNVRTYPVDQIAEVPGGRPPEGEPLPQVLHYVPKAPEEPEPDEWAVPSMLPEDFGPESEDTSAPAGENAGQTAKKSGSSRRRRKGKSPVKEAVRTEKQEKVRAGEPPQKPAPKAAPKTPKKPAAIHPIQNPQGEKPAAERSGSSRRNRNRRNRNRRSEGER